MIAPVLLQLRNIPIHLDIHTKPAVWEYTNGSADLRISRQRGGFTMKTQPGQLHIDTFEARNSIRPTAVESIKQSAQKGKQAAQEATATYVQQGKRAMECPIGEEVITQFVKEAQAKHVMTNIGLDFIPKAPARISYTPRELSMQYETDRLQFDWQVNPQHFEFTPADVQITMTQRPDVQITYVGDPIYVPRSADPNYRPIDVRA